MNYDVITILLYSYNQEPNRGSLIGNDLDYPLFLSRLVLIVHLRLALHFIVGTQLPALVGYNR